MTTPVDPRHHRRVLKRISFPEEMGGPSGWAAIARSHGIDIPDSIGVWLIRQHHDRIRGKRFGATHGRVSLYWLNERLSVKESRPVAFAAVHRSDTLRSSGTIDLVPARLLYLHVADDVRRTGAGRTCLRRLEDAIAIEFGGAADGANTGVDFSCEVEEADLPMQLFLRACGWTCLGSDENGKYAFNKIAVPRLLKTSADAGT